MMRRQSDRLESVEKPSTNIRKNFYHIQWLKSHVYATEKPGQQFMEEFCYPGFLFDFKVCFVKFEQ